MDAVDTTRTELVRGPGMTLGELVNGGDQPSALRVPVKGPAAALVLWSVASLVFFRVVDTGLFRLIAPHSRALAVVPDLRLTSLLVLVGLFVWTRPEIGWRPAWPGLKLWLVSLCWLTWTYAWVHATGIGKFPLARWEDLAAHVGAGLVAEELLVRVFVLGAALNAFRTSKGGWRPVLWSAAVFALMHHQYHAFRFDADSWLQAIWSFPLGVLLATLTARTRSVAPALFVHLLNNVLVVLA